MSTLKAYTIWYWMQWAKAGHFLLDHRVALALLILSGFVLYLVYGFVLLWMFLTTMEEEGEW